MVARRRRVLKSGGSSVSKCKHREKRQAAQFRFERLLRRHGTPASPTPAARLLTASIGPSLPETDGLCQTRGGNCMTLGRGGRKPLFHKDLRHEKNSAKPHFLPTFDLFRRRFADFAPERNRAVACGLAGNAMPPVVPASGALRASTETVTVVLLARRGLFAADWSWFLPAQSGCPARNTASLKPPPFRMSGRSGAWVVAYGCKSMQTSFGDSAPNRR